MWIICPCVLSKTLYFLYSRLIVWQTDGCLMSVRVEICGVVLRLIYMTVFRLFLSIFLFSYYLNRIALDIIFSLNKWSVRVLMLLKKMQSCKNCSNVNSDLLALKMLFYIAYLQIWVWKDTYYLQYLLYNRH